MICAITYSDDKMTISAAKCRDSMLRHGVDRVNVYQKDFEFGGKIITCDFQWMNRETLSAERGCGYWLWKPFYIFREMELHCKDGDILIYSDAGVEFINNVSHIISRMDEDIFFFTNGFPQVEWCKGDALSGILQWDVSLHGGDAAATAQRGRLEQMRLYKQVQASVIFFKVNQTTRNFVKEWLLYCQMLGFIDDSPSKLPNYPTFAEHRHDQAILTCLQIKYGYKLHWWPTAYAEHIRVPGDSYPVMFNHHRKRNNEW